MPRPRLTRGRALILAWHLLCLAALVAMALVTARAEAQDKAEFQVWSDAPNRIVVHWNNPDHGHDRYHEGFKGGEEYVVRWKATAAKTDNWTFADSKHIGASVGDPDVVIELPDGVAGGSEYDVSLYRTVHRDKQDCMGAAETLDAESCVWLGTHTIVTNLARTVGGAKPSAWWLGLGLLSPPRTAWAQQQPAGTLYATDFTSDSLYTVNRTTGAYTLVGSTGVSIPRGLAWNGATMYGANSDSHLYTVNLEDGSFTRLHTGGGRGHRAALEWADNVLYSTQFSLPGRLLTIDTTNGNGTIVGSAYSGDQYGLAWDGANMYNNSRGSGASLNTISRATAVRTSVGAVGNNITPAALAWDGAVLYGTDFNDNDSFYTVDRTTGTFTRVGATGTTAPGGLAFVPSATAPAAPGAPGLTVGNGQLEVSWVAPADGGSAITDYDVQYRATGGSNAWSSWSHTGTATTTTITGLTNGTKYEVQVRAVNARGNSDWSSSATITLPFPGAPATPVGVGAQGGEGRIILTWTNPDDDSITRYEYTAFVAGTPEPAWAQIPNSDAGATHHLYTTGGTSATFNFRLRAVNDNGPSLPSAEVAATPAAATSPPPQPASLSAATGSLAGTLLLTWKLDSADDAGIDRVYQIRHRPSGGNWVDWATVPNSWRGTLTHRVISLSSNTLYDLEVRASNSQGDSNPLTAGNVRTGGSNAPGAAPGKIGYFAYSAATTTSATLIWDAPVAGSVATLGYDMRHRRNVSPNPDWTTSLLASSINERQITGLLPGTPYEAQVRARNALASGPWSDVLYFETNSDLFRNAPPGNLTAENIAQSKTRIAVSLDWEAVLDATAYEVRVTSPDHQRIVGSAENRLEITYELAGTDTGNTLVFSVRGKRVSGSETTYTPWAPDVTLFYFVESTIPVSAVLEAEIAGSREVPQGVMDTRESLDDAITDVSEISGFEPDTRGLLDFLAVLPALIIVGTGAYAGMKFRALGLALGVSSVIAVMSMFVGVSLLGLDAIWPMLGLFGLIAFGVLSFLRKYRISTPVVLYALLFGALHVAAVFSQNVAGFSLSGAADYGDSIWSGTPVDDLLAIRKLDSYFDLRHMFTALGDTLFGLFRLVVFDYAAFQGHQGAALWFIALIKLALSLASSALLVTVIRQLFQTGIFNSTAGLAMVVGGVGAAAIISSVAGDAGGIPQVSITAAQQGASVEEGNPAVFVVSANPVPEQALRINITVTQQGGYVPSGSLGNKVVVVPPTGTAQFTIPTENDDANNGAGSVMVAVTDASAQSYQVREPSSATVAVTPILPAVTITANAQTQSSLGTSFPARFTLRTSPLLDASTSVNISVSESLNGDAKNQQNQVAAADRGEKTVTIPAGGILQYEVPTISRSGTSRLTVTVRPGSGYDPGRPDIAATELN